AAERTQKQAPGAAERAQKQAPGTVGERERAQKQAPAGAAERAQKQAPGATERAQKQAPAGAPSARQQAQPPEPRTGQPAAPGVRTSGSVSISQDQHTRISEVISRQSVQPLRSANFALAVGTIVPRSVRFHRLPAEIVEIVPEYRGYDYV